MMIFRYPLFCLTLLLVLSLTAAAQDDADFVTDSTALLPAPATSVFAQNHKYDDGEVIDVSWDKSPDDPQNITGYIIYRAREDGAFDSLRMVLPGETFFADDGVEDDVFYRYQIGVIGEGGVSLSDPSAPASATWEFFNFGMWNILLWMVVICGSVIGFIISAKAGRKLYIRKIGGLEALEEAVGRATEMGRPILFIPGILDMDDVQTLAAITILSRVARVVADYDSKIRMPVSRSLVLTSARETIKESYTSAGRPDAYNEDMVQYVTDEQFGYVAAVNGIMVREKPATCLYLGAFFAESLILAETGNSIGAIQIAGTARPGQLPFFVAACDYTLIGEELFAASAYLSGDPKQLGSLKGQDVGKVVAMAGLIIGTLAMTLSVAWQVPATQWILDLMMKLFTTN
jgi:hypothetical protein